MDELEKLANDAIETAVDYGRHTMHSYHTAWHVELARALNKAEQAKYNLLNYIEQNYKKK